MAKVITRAIPMSTGVSRLGNVIGKHLTGRRDTVWQNPRDAVRAALGLAESPKSPRQIARAPLSSKSRSFGKSLRSVTSGRTGFPGRSGFET